MKILFSFMTSQRKALEDARIINQSEGVNGLPGIEVLGRLAEGRPVSALIGLALFLLVTVPVWYCPPF